MNPKKTTLKAGTTLYHGTDCRPDIKVPDGPPVWFCLSFEEAAPWAGWGSIDGGGQRRVLVLTLTRDVEVFDTRTYADYKAVCSLLCDGDDDPLIMDVATKVCDGGHGGWHGKKEVMLADMTAVAFVEKRPVPQVITPYGRG
jgi:hypothetical protein